MNLLYRSKRKVSLLILFVFILNIFNVIFCSAQSGPFSASTTQSSQDRSSVIIGSAGSPERIVEINKVIIPQKDFYFPGESISLFAEIKFLKYKKDPWTLENFTVSELIDENLCVDGKSIRWAIINKTSEKSKYKTNKSKRASGMSSNISWTNENFVISIPYKIQSTQELIYWYNITLDNTGIFNADTVICSGQNTDFYHPYTSLKINVMNYSFFTPLWLILKEIIWVLIVFSGIFTFYNMVVSGDGVITPIQFLRKMIEDLLNLVKNISPSQIALVSTTLFLFLSYSYLSSLYPMHHKPISLIIISNWDLITGIGPIIALLFITIMLLYLKMEIAPNPIEQTITWITKDMPQLVAFILFILIISIPLILVIIDL